MISIQEGIQGLVFNGESGTKILAQAADCPFFVQPVFRDGGYFVLLSQFQDPRHFLLGYLEDYKQDPASAPPLMTISLFDDYSSSKDLTLIRCDVVNKSLQATTNNPKQEARQIVQHLLDNYFAEDDVRAFNKTPGSFDYDDYIARQSQKWKDYKDPSLVDGEAN
mmetsp:Transcript_20344/g.29418  ORF Transcript_20344/g.29418 Transcript_20344/m.29418 type:complete len:165 (+) Transcript_20344:1215-1709(+)